MSDAELTISAPPRDPSSARLVLTLAVAGMLSGAALAFVYEVTRPTIEANQAREREEAVRIFRDMLQEGGDGRRPDRKDNSS